ncbi:uncharacterized protein LOC143298309 [Babylonia areolata]|uniref:uncharacterized protein LOC143298309 n=1 Tax=Babylonia areolata TaxID=304850 RepID=UPI003FCFD48E
MTTARDKFFYTRTLCCLLKALEGVETEIELRNECHVKGTVESVSAAMDVTMRNCELIVGGRPKQLQRLLVQGRKIRMVIIPDDIDMVEAMQRVIGMYNVTAMGRNEFKKTPRAKQMGRGKSGRGGSRGGRGKTMSSRGRGFPGRGRGRGGLQSSRGRGVVDSRHDKSFHTQTGELHSASSLERGAVEQNVQPPGQFKRTSDFAGPSMLRPEYMLQASSGLMAGGDTRESDAQAPHMPTHSWHKPAASEGIQNIKQYGSSLELQDQQARHSHRSTSHDHPVRVEYKSTRKAEERRSSPVRGTHSSRHESSDSSFVDMSPGSESEHHSAEEQVQCPAVSSTASRRALASTDLRHRLRQQKSGQPESAARHRDELYVKRHLEGFRSYDSSPPREDKHGSDLSGGHSGQRSKDKQSHGSKHDRTSHKRSHDREKPVTSHYSSSARAASPSDSKNSKSKLESRREKDSDSEKRRHGGRYESDSADRHDKRQSSHKSHRHPERGASHSQSSPVPHTSSSRDPDSVRQQPSRGNTKSEKDPHSKDRSHSRREKDRSSGSRRRRHSKDRGTNSGEEGRSSRDRDRSHYKK